MSEEREEACEQPCSPQSNCPDCVTYWNRMRAEGFWVDGTGWTSKGWKEITK